MSITDNERKESVNEASFATSKLFSSIPSDKGTKIEEEEEEDNTGAGAGNEEEEDDDQGAGGAGSEEEDEEGEESELGTGLKSRKSAKKEEDEEDEEDEEEGEESELVSSLVTDFGEVELEDTNFENETDAVKAFVGAVSKREYSKGKEEGLTDLFKTFPEAEALVKHLNSGYTIDSFLKQIDVPDYSKIDLESASDGDKEKLYRDYLSALGNDEEDIEDAIETAKDTGKLDAKSERAQKYLVGKYQKEIEEQQKAELEQTKANKVKIEEENKKLEAILTSGNLEVANLSKTQTKELADFLGDNKKRGEIWKDLSVEKKLVLEYLVATDFKDLNFGKKEADLKVAKAIKIKSTKVNKSGLSPQGSPRVNLRNFTNGKK